MVTSSTMAHTKEGGELKAANLPNWVVLDPEEENAAEKNLRSKASAVPWLSSHILLTGLLAIVSLFR